METDLVSIHKDTAQSKGHFSDSYLNIRKMEHSFSLKHFLPLASTQHTLLVFWPYRLLLFSFLFWVLWLHMLLSPPLWFCLASLGHPVVHGMCQSTPASSWDVPAQVSWMISSFRPSQIPSSQRGRPSPPSPPPQCFIFLSALFFSITLFSI